MPNGSTIPETKVRKWYGLVKDSSNLEGMILNTTSALGYKFETMYLHSGQGTPATYIEPLPITQDLEPQAGGIVDMARNKT